MKTRIATLAAIAAGLTVTIAGAQGSGAFARAGENQQVAAVQQVTEETVPVFVSQEVVQPLPGSEETDKDSSEAAAPEANSLRELVAEIPDRSKLSSEMECLAGAVYFESRGEPLAGQLAVAQVIVNRTESSDFPSSYCGVVYQRSQFSFVKGRSMPHIRRGSPAWKRAKAIARIAHEGLWDSKAGKALYFHARYVHPGWSRTKVALATIDSHIFYR